VEYGWGLAHRLAELDPGTRVLLAVPWRGMEPPDPDEAHVLYYCPMSHASRLGFTLVWQEGRALVQSVEPGSKAEAAGLAPGDVLLRAMDMAVDSIWTLHKAGIRARDQGVPLALDVERAGSRLALAIPVAAEPTK
jgi:S1-C subfamily serine protease